VKDEPVERLYREIRPLRIYEGATEVQQLIIARGILKSFQGCAGSPKAARAPKRGDHSK
jgi:acyl-CoA dehydrogenase